MLTEDKEFNRLNLLKTLAFYGISATAERFNGGINYVVKAGNWNNFQNKIITVGAHYDTYPHSKAYNDNACSVAVLIKFILGSSKLNLIDLPIEVVFFDREETGFVGSRNYITARRKADVIIQHAVILDIVGYGDKLYSCGVAGENDEEHLKKSLRDVGVKQLDTMLDSDNMSFNMSNIENHLIVALHDEDIVQKEEKTTVNYGSTAVFKSFHNRELDNDINIIKWDAVDTVLQVLYNLVSKE